MPTAVVLGAYGLIGSARLRALREAGFDVTGVGRSLAAGHRVDPDITWVAADIASTSTERWRELLGCRCRRQCLRGISGQLQRQPDGDS